MLHIAVRRAEQAAEERMLARIGSAFIAVWLTVIGLPGARADDNQVDLLLVLAADVSRSVDAAKFKLQREGYAAAITDPRVIRAMTGGTHRRIALASSSGPTTTSRA
jgi:hypothetical protein